MKVLKKISVALLLFFLGKSTLSAQVTIGDSSAPNTGALLDLKQNTNLGVNSSLGMSMPRVHIKSSNRLSPMLDDFPTYASDANVKSAQDKIHTGLLVYNTNQCLLGGGSDEGLMVWDGSEWVSLLGIEETPTMKSNQDQDGNIFYSREFGDAGEWMLQNVRATKYSNNDPIPTAGWGKPNVNAPANAGYLYSKNAALHKTDAELSGTYNASTVNGVCPIDWRIPTDNDWISLEKEINKNTSLYASAANINESWNNSWNTSTGTSRGQFGEAMKALCLLVTTDITQSTDGKSFSSGQGGFNVILSGSGDNTYGSEAKYWTSTVATAPNVITRLFKKGDKGVIRKSENSGMGAIRCLKDNNFQCGQLLKDSEGNTYTTALFGNQCWMTQNLRSTNGLSQNQNTTNQEAIYYRPTSGSADTEGYLYTWKAASMDQYSTETIMLDNSSTIKSEVQGICPAGWVLPSDYDWNTLEQTLAGTWSANNNNTEGWVAEGKVGDKMRLSGGANFNAKMVGSSISGTLTGTGTTTNFWSSSDVFTPLGTSQNAIYRGLSTSENGVYRGAASKASMVSIRCVQKQ